MTVLKDVCLWLVTYVDWMDFDAVVVAAPDEERAKETALHLMSYNASAILRAKCFTEVGHYRVALETLPIKEKDDPDH